MTIYRIFRSMGLFALLFTPLGQLNSVTQQSGALQKVGDQSQQPPLPLGIRQGRLERSLAQFTRDGMVTDGDLGAYLLSVERGAHLAYQLFFTELPIPEYVSRKAHLSAIADLIAFFYLLAMLTREDGLMPADVTFGIVETDQRAATFLRNYRTRVAERRLNLGSTSSMFGGNHLAYFRNQSHGFKEAWGITMYYKKKHPLIPLLFPNRWLDAEGITDVSGPLYHLLVGTDPYLSGKWYLKPEACGIYYWGEWFGHVAGYVKAVCRRTALVNRLIDSDDDPAYNKEHLPRAVLSTFKECSKRYLKRFGTQERHAARRGIAGMYAHARKHGWKEFTSYIEARFSFPPLRRGNEIIINRETVFWTLRSVQGMWTSGTDNWCRARTIPYAAPEYNL
ncbi:MAG: hypothetical protein M1549_00950 [Candidatus Dependentiae bacterium]|nr:hypothetical protein [Candidatus Dependentiae bacterium]